MPSGGESGGFFGDIDGIGGILLRIADGKRSGGVI